MKYSIPGTYHSEKQHCVVDAWLLDKGDHNLNFLIWLKQNTGADNIRGNFEDGWTLEFDQEEKYTWFLLKWTK
jgi:hypothetical protein